jgi:tRNA pseudouridine38-40 synthase
VGDLMPRYRLTIEYDGAGFVGWQRQENGLSVQTALEQALAAFTGEQPEVTGAGRTDAGVHAAGQVAHVDLTREWEIRTLINAMNAHLRPQPVAVLEAAAVPHDFHARFSATKRHYGYRILNRLAPPALERGRVWHIIRPLDDRAMHAAAQMLVGRHDFTSFRSTECQAKSPVKTLDQLDVRRMGDEVQIETSARSFLHNQVRAMVGSLRKVGEGKWSAVDLVRAREARDRSAAGPTAPAEGLCLMRVDYSD